MACYFPKTRSARQINTLTFFPHTIPFPEVTTEDFLKQAALDIVSILSNPPTSLPISLEAGDSTKNAILQTAEVLGTVVSAPKLLSLPLVNRNNNTQVPRVETANTSAPRVNKTKIVVKKNVY